MCAHCPKQSVAVDTYECSTLYIAIKMSTPDDDDDLPQLSGDTLQLLQQFNEEKDARTKQFEEVKAQSELNFSNGAAQLSMNLFTEDWNASQFWYTDTTARTIAQQLLECINEDSAIAVVSAPSVFVQLKNILAESTTAIKPRLCLLEYDTRFEIFGSDFVPYDYQHPLRLPPELKGKFDRIIADPPFLSEDCQAKTALTVRFLARSWPSGPPSEEEEGMRMIMCTGERMEAVVKRLYAAVGVKTTTFEPMHSHGLSNEFWCYANFECKEWTWR